MFHIVSGDRILDKLEEKLEELYYRIIKRCRSQRKSRSRIKIRALASQMGLTENYLSAVENAREFPSLKTFLKYLLLLGFDTKPLENLEIAPEQLNKNIENTEKGELIGKILRLDQDQVSFLIEQAKLAEIFKPRSKGK